MTARVILLTVTSKITYLQP